MSNMSDTATRSLHDQVAEEIRVMFVRRKLSQAEAARRLGWSQFYLSHRLTGKTPINVNDLEALAGLLGVEPTAFFPRSGGVGANAVNVRYLRRRPLTSVDLGCINTAVVPAVISSGQALACVA